MFLSSVRKWSKRYAEMCYSYNITLYHNPKELDHHFHRGEGLRPQPYKWLPLYFRNILCDDTEIARRSVLFVLVPLTASTNILILLRGPTHCQSRISRSLCVTMKAPLLCFVFWKSLFQISIQKPTALTGLS